MYCSLLGAQLKQTAELYFLIMITSKKIITLPVHFISVTRDYLSMYVHECVLTVSTQF